MSVQDTTPLEDLREGLRKLNITDMGSALSKLQNPLSKKGVARIEELAGTLPNLPITTGLFEPTLVNKTSVITNKFLKNAPENAQYRIYLDVSGSSKYRDITSAGEPVLPMYIAIPDKNGNRLEMVLFINPESINHSKTQAAALNYTRSGYIPQLWGLNQPTLSSTGKTAAFIVDGGLTTMNRKYSTAFLNFASFLSTYKNNGYRFLDLTQVGDKQRITRVINTVYGVEIIYDDQIFMGHFNNFTIDESADTPFLFNYNFEFIISSLSGDYSQIRGHFQALPPHDMGDTGETGGTDQVLVNALPDTVTSHAGRAPAVFPEHPSEAPIPFIEME